jgi:hypothetical protein
MKPMEIEWQEKNQQNQENSGLKNKNGKWNTKPFAN